MKQKILSSLTVFLLLITFILLPLSTYQQVHVSAFMNFSVFIDPGHGGNDNGTSYLDVFEDEINLSIGEKLYEICMDKQLKSYISRVDDYDLSSLYSPNHKKEDLKKRAEYINQTQCDIFVSLHVNQYTQKDVHGAMVYYERNDSASYELAKCVQKELNVITKINKQVHSDNFYLFRQCTVPGILIECGFISNEDERGKLQDDLYQKAIAQAIYEGIYSFYLSI